MTQFGWALHALNIDIICANSSPAKGRVERAHKTLQDRLVKELRLAGAATLAQGNALLPGFIADYNARFAKPPADKKDLHRPLRAGDDLEDARSKAAGIDLAIGAEAAHEQWQAIWWSAHEKQPARDGAGLRMADIEPGADMGAPLSGLLVASKRAQFTPALTASTV
jgi:hypothetical protein